MQVKRIVKVRKCETMKIIAKISFHPLADEIEKRNAANDRFLVRNNLLFVTERFQSQIVLDLILTCKNLLPSSDLGLEKTGSLHRWTDTCFLSIFSEYPIQLTLFALFFIRSLIIHLVVRDISQEGGGGGQKQVNFFTFMH